MKKLVLLTAALILAASSAAFAASLLLPEPDRGGGPSVLEAIALRASAEQKNFAKDELTQEELSTILWAASGKNREPRGWTVPMAMGREPYVSIYVLLRKGGFLYSWEKHALIEQSDEKRLPAGAVTQDFAKTAPCVLVFVGSGMMNVENFSYIATGAMSQNVYLAAQALGLKARFVESFNRLKIESSLNLSPVAKITGVMLVGRQ